MSLTMHEPRAVERMPEQANEGTAVLEMIERAARDPAVDVAKMRELFAMRKEMLADQARCAFNAAMAAVKAELPRVLRDANNEQTRSKYARLETISAAVDPIISRHGFSLSFDTDASPLAGHIRITCTVANGGHERGYKVDLPLDDKGMKGVANKTATHATGSTISYGRRYLKLLIFDIALTNEDTDGNRARDVDAPEPEMITPAQVEELRALLKQVGRTEEQFLAKIGLPSLDAIFADRFFDAVQLLRSVKK